MAPLFCSANAADTTEQVKPDLGAATRQEMVSLPEPPAWPAAPPAPLYTFDDIVQEFKGSSHAHPEMVHQAQSFVRPDLRWLKAYVKWFGKLEKPLHFEYEDQTFDCDKFSRCFVAFADLLARKQGEARASVCVGWVTVHNDVAFGGVGAGNGHALVLAATTSGLFIIEPQTGTMVPLAQYPNRDQLQAVNF